MLLIIITFVLLISGVAGYIFFNKQPQQPQKVEILQPVAADVPKEKIKEPQGVSFKQLKNQAKKKGGKTANPDHESYVSALKGMQSAIVDFDFYLFQDGSTLFVVGEESQTVRAFLVKDFNKESEFISG